MGKTDIRQALNEIEPTTKAAKVRRVMPVIEQKIAEGVRIAEILKTLEDGGVELSEATLKSYLYRYRKKKGDGAGSVMPAGGVRLPDATKAHLPKVAEPLGPVSLQELDRVMKPDPVEQADELARYERLAKQQRRSRKP